MIGPKEVERYRQMTIQEKFAEFNHLMDVAFQVLDGLSRPERRRRWEIWTRSDEDEADKLAECLASLPK